MFPFLVGFLSLALEPREKVASLVPRRQASALLHDGDLCGILVEPTVTFSMLHRTCSSFFPISPL